MHTKENGEIPAREVKLMLRRQE